MARLLVTGPEASLAQLLVTGSEASLAQLLVTGSEASLAQLLVTGSEASLARAKAQGQQGRWVESCSEGPWKLQPKRRLGQVAEAGQLCCLCDCHWSRGMGCLQARHAAGCLGQLWARWSFIREKGMREGHPVGAC